MNQTCKVCGEPAAGFHFGAFTCEGCKSFFGRSYNNLPSISECKNNNECIINKKNRTSCKSCRLRKCLMVGMSKSGSRYGRRSNWFKIHCLLQEQQQQADLQKNGNVELLLQLEKYTNNNSIATNNNLSPQISPKSLHNYEDKLSSQLSPRNSPRTLTYADHSISPNSVDMNMNYYNIFPQIMLANNFSYYQQLKYQNKRVHQEEDDENSDPDIRESINYNQIEDKSKDQRYLGERCRYQNDSTSHSDQYVYKHNYQRISRNNNDSMEYDRLDARGEVRGEHFGNSISDRDRVQFVSPSIISDHPSDCEEQDVPIDLSIKTNTKLKENEEESDVDITTYGSDEETIDVTSVSRSKTSLVLDLTEIRR
ncbi:hypothetical protein WDU94_006543 [Cyamophila willieti]